ncbi:MAG: P-type conjugative transfer protein VirB9 [Alphaproteobacteria bacterium]|nr:P-type conjugative transfer protein VirB9 [Alphaproteobacteria bacterium]
MKNTFRTLVLTCVMGVSAATVLTFSTAQPAYALKESKPIAADKRIRTVVYNANEVFKFVGHYDYQSVIEFESDEEVFTVSMGNSVTWQITPAGNRIFIKPVQQDALTNMTVITNKRTYHFELHAEMAENINDPDMVFVMRFIYGRGAGIGVSNYIDSVPDPMIEPEKYNFDYALTGAEEISPIRIFDDGEFTYFEFRDKNAEVPAFFLVHGDGSESIINFRARGNYIIVERVAAQFTLRHGQDVVCIFNRNMGVRTSGATPRPISKKKWYQFGEDETTQPNYDRRSGSNTPSLRESEATAPK